MVIVLVDQITNRIQYTFDFIFKERGITYELTTSRENFNASNKKRFNYSSKVASGIGISPSELLSASDIESITTSKTKFNAQGCLSFNSKTDLVASIFYVLTRYEEYLCKEVDEHGRFPFEKSILAQYNWIEQAMCDRWAEELIDFILPDFNLKKENITPIVPTFDIDNAYAYHYKEGMRRILSVMKDVFKGDKRRIKERKEVLTNEIKDPYDTYQQIETIANKFPATKLFWLVESNGKKDRNVPLEMKEIKTLINNLKTKLSIGLHPSYQSFKDLTQLKAEKTKLESVINVAVKNSRQHFLRFSLPETFQDLITSGFTDEYSMGFAEHIGFRCGTARTHQWFDLSKNEITALNIHPFVYMDGTLNEYMQLSVEQSKVKIAELFIEVSQYGGDFTFLWHNETIGDYQKWKGWSEVLDFSLTLNQK